MNWGHYTQQQVDDCMLYGMCPNRHPLSSRTTVTIVDNTEVIHEEIYCPTCENDGTVGVLVLEVQ